MATTFIAAAGGNAAGAGTTLDCSGSLNVAAGDALVAWVCNETGTSTYAVAKSAGSPANSFTFDAGDAIANNVFGSLGYLLNASADATATFRATWGTSRDIRRIIVMQFRPTAGSTVTKDTSAKGTGLGTASSSGNITTTGTDEIVCGGSDLFNSGATTLEKINAVAADGVSRQSAASIWYRILTGTFAAAPAICTQAISDSWICGVIALKITAGGGGTRGLFRVPPLSGTGIGGSFFADPLAAPMQMVRRDRIFVPAWLKAAA